jgi:hypothetical protein
MGRELAVQTSGASRAVSIDLANLNFDIASKSLAKYQKQLGAGEGGGFRFPGAQIQFKKGEWFSGYKDTKKVLNTKGPIKLVLNIPNMMLTWVKWEDNANGKRRPNYLPVCYPFNGDDLPDRETLGDLDEKDWELDDENRPQDPWNLILVYPARDADSEIINHIYMDGPTKRNAAFNLFTKALEEMKLRPGSLPIIELSTENVSRKIKSTKTVRGKQVDVEKEQTWQAPTFKIAGWVEAVDADNPGPGGVQVTDDSDDADVGEVKTTARSKQQAPKKEDAATKAAVKQNATKKRRVVEADDEDDDL